MRKLCFFNGTNTVMIQLIKKMMKRESYKNGKNKYFISGIGIFSWWKCLSSMQEVPGSAPSNAKLGLVVHPWSVSTWDRSRRIKNLRSSLGT